MSCIAIVSCVRTPTTHENWPQSLPPLSYFLDIYEADEVNQAVQSQNNYLLWVKRFYQGSKLYSDGWESITQDLLLNIEDPGELTVVRYKMDHLGKLISGEWSKISTKRSIYSRDLSIWGQALLESIERQDEEKLIDQVTQDVEAMLAGDIKPKTISIKRYYDIEDEFN